METKEVHIRFCCCSKPFMDKLIELGFKEKGSDPDSFYTKQVRRFYKGNLEVEDSYAGLYLYANVDQTDMSGISPKTKKTRVLRYHGLSVNKELLENFARKGIYNQ